MDPMGLDDVESPDNRMEKNANVSTCSTFLEKPSSLDGSQDKNMVTF